MLLSLLAIIISRCSTIGPSASAGTKVSAPTMITTPTSSTTNSGVCVGSVPGPAGHELLARQRAGDRQHRNGQPVAGDEHREAAGEVVERRVGGQAGEGAAVVVARERKGVEHLAEAVRAGIEIARTCPPR